MTTKETKSDGTAVLSSALLGPTTKPRAALLELAMQCGAVLTGKPDGSEAITVVFAIPAWRAFDAALGSNAGDKQ
jgi:hypothetical protein